MPFLDPSERKVHMKNFIGGLFQTEKLTYEAYRALQEAGFDNEDIMILSRKNTGARPLRESVSIQSVAIRAIIGGLLGGGLAALLGFLIGQGVIHIPAFIPQPDPFFTLNAFGLFLAEGVITGAFLGVVSRLAAAREKPAITRSGITHGGVVLAINVDEGQSKSAERLLEEAGAVDLVNLTEKWTPNVWSEFRQLQPP
jgi:hypothetical protein